MTAALALGTYRVRDVAEAARMAVQAGTPWIDTAPNYGDGRALHDLGRVLRDAPSPPLVATKAGFFTRSQGRAALSLGLLTEGDVSAGHCLDPSFIAHQVEESLALLGRVDLMFVHNPERAGRGVDRPVMHWRLREAFAVLEERAHDGQIPGYGVATWSGLQEGAFSVPELLALAREAAGSADHHLIAVQMPVGLIDDAPLTQSLNGTGPLVQAKEAGLITFGSAPLHGGELLDAMTPELVDLIRPGLSAGAAGVLAAASCPALDFVLTSTTNRDHWDDAVKALASPLAPEHLRRVTDELAT
ncbi:aldo/keto reductase [Streptomyces xanthophaeus]|uniref:aldo/keto reductase n=1 Tax=Streptomyces xanthophaeus TaxID=67385 RepID=UPI00364D53A4